MADLDLSEEKHRLNELLASGLIDRETYDIETGKLFRQESWEKTRRRRSNPIPFNKILIFIIFIVITVALVHSLKSKAVKPVLVVDDLSNIPDPVQIKTSGSAMKIVNGTEVDIEYVAEYSIAGRVVATRDYTTLGSTVTVDNLLRPVDVGLTWGFLAHEEYDDKMTWSLSNRLLTWTSYETEWISSMGGIGEIQRHFSNNHIIPVDDEIEQLAKQIKKNDYIRMDGYLVNVTWSQGNSEHFVNSSTSRSDSGSHACETIYVTSITWLQNAET